MTADEPDEGPCIGGHRKSLARAGLEIWVNTGGLYSLEKGLKQKMHKS